MMTMQNDERPDWAVRLYELVKLAPEDRMVHIAAKCGPGSNMIMVNHYSQNTMFLHPHEAFALARALTRSAEKTLDIEAGPNPSKPVDVELYWDAILIARQRVWATAFSEVARVNLPPVERRAQDLDFLHESTRIELRFT